jgi:aspartate/methionine/tyrosine aminotransferase
VYGAQDLVLLARFCQQYDVVAVCDEVWEHVVFDARAHIPLIGLPGMRERCVKIGSAGKIFSLTGWKVGFVCAAPAILRVLAKAHQFITFTTPPNLQAAVAYGLAKDDDYFVRMRGGFQRSRDRFVAGLRGLGLPVLEAQGTYFVNVDLKPLGLNEDDESFCKRLVAEHRVAAQSCSRRANAPNRSARSYASALPSATRRLMRRLSALPESYHARSDRRISRCEGAKPCAVRLR